MEKPSTSTFLDLGSVALPKDLGLAQTQQSTKEGFSLFDTLLNQMSAEGELLSQTATTVLKSDPMANIGAIQTSLPVNSFSLFDSITAQIEVKVPANETVQPAMVISNTILQDLPSELPIKTVEVVGKDTLKVIDFEVKIASQTTVDVKNDHVEKDSFGFNIQKNVPQETPQVTSVAMTPTNTEASLTEALIQVSNTLPKTQQSDDNIGVIKPQNDKKPLELKQTIILDAITINNQSLDNESFTNKIKNIVQETPLLVVDDVVDNPIKSTDATDLIDTNSVQKLDQGLFDELVTNIKINIATAENIPLKVSNEQEQITQTIAPMNTQMGSSTEALLSNDEVLPTQISSVVLIEESTPVGIVESAIQSITITQNEFDEIVTTPQSTEVVFATKETTKSESSLIDEIIIQETKAKSNTQEPTKSSVVIESRLSSNIAQSSSAEDLLGNMYMGSQKASTNLASLAQIHDAKQVFSNGESTLGTLKKGGNILGLGVKSIEEISPSAQLTQSKSIFEQESKSLEQVVSARVMFFQEEVQDKLALGEEEIKKVNQGFNDNVVVIKVQDTLTSNSLESKIIGARQHINSMMSDVARSMYEQYKPPLTAFKINLNPSQLGGIAIILKSDKSGIDISMSMSKQTTLETFIDTQSLLKTQIIKNFGENTNVNLNFSMQQDTQSSQEQANNQNGQQNPNNNSKQAVSTSDIEISVNEELEKNQSYM